jgi:putative membrane protein
MNRTLLAAVSLILGSALLVHCGGDQKSADSPASTPTIAPAELPPAPTTGPDAGPPADAAPAASDGVKPTGSQPDAAKPDALNDEQIAAITDGANSTEVEQGKIARLKSKDRDVQHFSAKMIAAHEEAKKNQDKLDLKTAESALGNTFGTEAASTMNTLKAAEGTAFDKAYIDAQVDEHQKLLDALNDKLIPNVKNPDLKAYLNQIQPHVAQHLKEAQSIQKALAAKTAAAPAASAPVKSAAK